MEKRIKIKRGFNLPLAGECEDGRQTSTVSVKKIAIIPDDFHGLTPKLDVKEGDSIAEGEKLFHDKQFPDICVVSPASGTVKAIVRGERRKILRIEIEVNGSNVVKLETGNALNNAEAARKLLLESGIWAFFTQRPFAIIPASDAQIRDIFVTGFDSAPLAVNTTTFSDNELKAITNGVAILKLLTSGKVYISRRDNQNLTEIAGAEIITVDGPHPSGNASVIINAIKPINKGEKVVCLNIDTLIKIGNLLEKGFLEGSTTVAITGSEVITPKLVKTTCGASVEELLNGEIKPDDMHHRIISGNVLTGKKVGLDGYLRKPYTQITVIPEGDDKDEFMGWATLSSSKMSLSPSFPGKVGGKKRYTPDARLLGGERAMILGDVYDKYLPMDILGEYLIKAIIAKDIDRMEKLGIYEVAPEDFALIEYADASKMPLQQIVEDGIEYLRKELE